MCNSILCHIIKLPHICLYPDDSARQLFFFCTTFHILREIFLFVTVFLSFLYEFCMNLFCFLYRFCYIFHYPVFIFALSKIFLFLYCCFCYPFHFLADLQLHDGRLMFHCRNNLLHQIFCPKSETRCIDAWMTSYIFSCKHIFIDQKPYHPVLIIHQSKHT